jgi:hypothetical protein
MPPSFYPPPKSISIVATNREEICNPFPMWCGTHLVDFSTHVVMHGGWLHVYDEVLRVLW